MANWLLDYMEMTEYIPSEMREQLTSIRELDLQVHNAMDDLERDIKQFFSRIDTLSPKERQEQYDAFLKKCDVATRAASDKVKVADRLHELLEKSMRLLDQGLEKLKEDLLEGDKAYVVEDLERKSQEIDEQTQLEREYITHRHQNKFFDVKTNAKGHKFSKDSSSNYINSLNNRRHSNPAQHNSHLFSNHRSRHNSTGAPNSAERQRKRERKRLNNTMSIFNRNSTIEDESSNQTFLTSPLTPDYLSGGLQNPLSDVSAGNSDSLTIKGIMAGNRNSSGNKYKSNGTDPLAVAKQPILTAIDAAHAVSPSAANSDNPTLINDKYNHINPHSANHHPQEQNQLSKHLLSTVRFNPGDGTMTLAKNERLNHDHNHRTEAPFSALPLSSKHDPIMVAASQAINATRNMAPGRRTSSLKASYAAVNSGRLQTVPNQQPFNQSGLLNEVYCKCRSHIQGSNMIACDNKKCKIEWFHYECVGITTPPEGDWYCDECKIFKKLEDLS